MLLKAVSLFYISEKNHTKYLKYEYEFCDTNRRTVSGSKMAPEN